MVEYTKGSVFRLKERLSSSKIFTKGSLIILKRDRHHSSGNRMDDCEYESYPDGKTYSGYGYLHTSNLEPVSKEEIEEMSKPSEYVIHVIGTNNFTKTSESGKDKILTNILTANPTAEVAVYSLQGVAKTEPVKVQFTMAASLD